MKILRLLITKDCPRNCERCCNKQFDIENLPICTDYTGWDMITLTGGEPLMDMRNLGITIHHIRKSDIKVPIVVYTAMVNSPARIKVALSMCDGITLTLHEPDDYPNFQVVCSCLDEYDITEKSMRLNVFKGISSEAPSYWQVKDNIVWLDDCPLPENEVLMRTRW